MRVNGGRQPSSWIVNPMIRWLVVLRTVEYLRDCEHGRVWWPVRAVLRLYLHRLSVWLGFSIPPGTCGPGLWLPHHGTIIVHQAARLGARCTIHPGVTIGASRGQVPTIGSDVILDPGAKVFGPVTMADGSRAAANAVVTSDVPAGTIAFGVPARARARLE
jgi:serine O-acetyltransferase